MTFNLIIYSSRTKPHYRAQVATLINLQSRVRNSNYLCLYWKRHIIYLNAHRNIEKYSSLKYLNLKSQIVGTKLSYYLPIDSPCYLMPTTPEWETWRKCSSICSNITIAFVLFVSQLLIMCHVSNYPTLFQLRFQFFIKNAGPMGIIPIKKTIMTKGLIATAPWLVGWCFSTIHPSTLWPREVHNSFFQTLQISKKSL